MAREQSLRWIYSTVSVPYYSLFLASPIVSLTDAKNRSLVPVNKMYSAKWHRLTAFQWGCFAQGRFKCPYKPGPKSDRLRFLRTCGTDESGNAFSSLMRVPEVFPDGDYVFSQVWYGGVNVLKSGKKIMFPDFKTCAFVRISGGLKLKSAYRPQFNAGFPSKNDVPRGICRSFASKVNECGGLSCKKNKIIWDAPLEFRRGGYPPLVLLKNLKGQVSRR